MVPTAALKMGVGTVAQGKLPEMLDKGVCVGLGTDAGNNSNLVETMRSMYRGGRAVQGWAPDHGNGPSREGARNGDHRRRQGPRSGE